MLYRISPKESIQINESNTCAAKSCHEHRDGYSRYCAKHKEHYRCYGSIYQDKVLNFKHDVMEIRKEVEKELRLLLKNEGNLSVELHGNLAYLRRLIDTPRTTLTSSDIKEHIKDGLGLRESKLKITNKTCEVIVNDYARSPLYILSLVIATFIYQYRYPARLLSGRPLYMYVFKAFMLGTKLAIRLNQYGQKRYYKRKIAYHQGLLIGAILGSKLSIGISHFLEIERLKRREQEKMFESIVQECL